jgi:hypothetical protein
MFGAIPNADESIGDCMGPHRIPNPSAPPLGDYVKHAGYPAITVQQNKRERGNRYCQNDHRCKAYGFEIRKLFWIKPARQLVTLP